MAVVAWRPDDRRAVYSLNIVAAAKAATMADGEVAGVNEGQ